MAFFPVLNIVVPFLLAGLFGLVYGLGAVAAILFLVVLVKWFINIVKFVFGVKKETSLPAEDDLMLTKWGERERKNKAREQNEALQQAVAENTREKGS